MRANIDPATVEGFGEEWSRFDQAALSPEEHRRLFDAYFRIFPWDRLPADAQGFDLGCGSGRWAKLVAPRVGRLHCIDPSPRALEVARRNLSGVGTCEFHLAGVDDIPLAEGSMDFGYSLGVLHHIPDTAQGLAACVRKLKSGAPFLCYLYYRFDNRPDWYQRLWRASEVGRRFVSRLPHDTRAAVADVIAAGVYWPLARMARLAHDRGADVSSFPLSTYRDASFYTMRTDALDRFGTALEQRFTRSEMHAMMEAAGLDGVSFSEEAPYWCAVGYKR